jgi:hypothetical protein
MIWRGVVEDGQGNCSRVAPFPLGWFQGSLNLHAVDVELHGVVRNWRPGLWAWVEWMPTVFPVRLPEFGIEAIMGLDPVTRVHEVVARVKLRDAYNLQNGDVVTVEVDDDLLLAYGKSLEAS